MAQPVRIIGKSDSSDSNEGIQAQVQEVYNALHVKSHLYGFNGLSFDNPLRVDSNGSSRTKLYDNAGNPIASHLSADGDYHLGVQMEQSVLADDNNSSTTNLDAAGVFTGVGTSTLGVVGLQWSLKASENCTVYIEQSPDNTNWDISYTFNYIASKGGQGETVQATQAYWRIRVTNVGMITTSYFRLQGVLCPIATPLPSSLSDDARLKTETTMTGRTNSERHAWINPTNEQASSPVYRMVGTNFDGATKDPNFWTELNANGGGVTQGGGEVEVETSTATNGWAKYTSVRKARFVAGSAQYFQGGFNFKTAATTDNIRRCGAYTTTATVNTPVDGFYFELDNATFSVNSVSGSGALGVGVVNNVDSGAFNGSLGLSWIPTADTYYSLTIEWTPLSAWFYVNGELLHKMAGAHLSYYMTLPVTMENIYTSGAVDVNFETVSMYIARQGELHTNPTYKYIPGNTTSICKYGAGVLHSIIVADNTGDVYIYDGLTAAAPSKIISLLDTAQGSEAMGSVIFNVPFSDGLTIETDGAVPVTAIYE